MMAVGDGNYPDHFGKRSPAESAIRSGMLGELAANMAMFRIRAEQWLANAGIYAAKHEAKQQPTAELIPDEPVAPVVPLFSGADLGCVPPPPQPLPAPAQHGVQRGNLYAVR